MLPQFLKMLFICPLQIFILSSTSSVHPLLFKLRSPGHRFVCHDLITGKTHTMKYIKKRSWAWIRQEEGFNPFGLPLFSWMPQSVITKAGLLLNLIRSLIGLKKLAETSRPTRWRSKTNRGLITRAFPCCASGRLHVFNYSLWFKSFFLIDSC